MGLEKSNLHPEIAVKVDSGEIPLAVAYELAKMPQDQQLPFWAATKQKRQSAQVHVFTTPDGKEYLQRRNLGE